MRFLLFDKILEHDDKSVRGVKLITRTEDAFEGHFTRKSIYPSALMIESMVQVLGWLVMRRNDYGVLVVLTGLKDVVLPPALEPGAHVEIHGELQSTNKRGSIGRCSATVGGVEVASIGRAIYGHVPHDDPETLRERFTSQGAP